MPRRSSSSTYTRCLSSTGDAGASRRALPRAGLLGTWPFVLAVLERQGRLLQHTYIDYSITSFLAAVLVAFTFGQISGNMLETPNFLTHLTQAYGKRKLSCKWPLSEWMEVARLSSSHGARRERKVVLRWIDSSILYCVYFKKNSEPEPYIGKIWQQNEAKKVKILWFFSRDEIRNYLTGPVVDKEIFLASGDGIGLADIKPLDWQAASRGDLTIPYTGDIPAQEDLQVAMRWSGG